ncbi:MAG: CoA pyrophosphatase [Candidatus Binatia bacterium]
MKVALIRERLLAHRPEAFPENGYDHAAVAVVLREGSAGAEFVAIRRSEREGDPWSGHMALPGGREHPSDKDLLMTVSRETREEVGIDLRAHGQLLGQLDDLPAFAGGRPIRLVITPFVFAVNAPVEFALNRREVDRAFWVPLGFLRQPEARGRIRLDIAGLELEQDTYVYEGHTIWGLTYRILSRLLEVL